MKNEKNMIKQTCKEILEGKKGSPSDKLLLEKRLGDYYGILIGKQELGVNTKLGNCLHWELENYINFSDAKEGCHQENGFNENPEQMMNDFVHLENNFTDHIKGLPIDRGKLGNLSELKKTIYQDTQREIRKFAGLVWSIPATFFTLSGLASMIPFEVPTTAGLSPDAGEVYHTIGLAGFGLGLFLLKKGIDQFIKMKEYKIALSKKGKKEQIKEYTNLNSSQEICMF